MNVYIGGIGLCAPGLAGWAASRAVLAGGAPYRGGDMPKLDHTRLPRNEARRAGFTVRLALQVAEEARAGSAELPEQMCSVFACSSGNAEALDHILTALTLPQRPVSPNQFHNSVHNAPAGYWSIATGCRAPSTSLSAYDASFAAGLLELVGMVLTERRPGLLVAYDVPLPPALFPFRPISGPFGTALLLTPARSDDSRHRLRLEIATKRQEDRLPDPGLEALRTNNSAARSLPLLKAIAQRWGGQVVLPYLFDNQLLVVHEPC